MSTDRVKHGPLRQELDGIASSAGAVLRSVRIRRERQRALDAAWWIPICISSLWLLLCVVAILFGAAPFEAPRWLPALLTIIFPVVWLLARWALAATLHVRRRECLVAVDDALQLADRLTTADEFLAREERTPFMQAAVADAASFMDRAMQVEIQRTLPSWRLHRRWGIAAAVSAALIILASVIESPVYQNSAAPTSTETGELAELDPKRFQDDIPQAAQREANENPETARQTVLEQAGGSQSRKERLELTKDIKKTRGRTGVGQPSDAASASGSSHSAGSPTNQAQTGMSSKKKSKKKAKKKSKKKPTGDPVARKKPQDDSGATAGRGAATGSNRSPASSVWSSKDQVVSDDEEDLEDDADVEDEFDDSDARGGVQPHLRDRRPPVNRDLSIGFGNQKNPDANGRGGASEQKKSRGVASLVLGVPIPDHIKAKPNPGKTKITQERVEPQAENAPSLAAQSRLPRSGPSGHLTRPELSLWMREFVKSYYLSLRSKQPRE